MQYESIIQRERINDIVLHCSTRYNSPAKKRITFIVRDYVIGEFRNIYNHDMYTWTTIIIVQCNMPVCVF